MKTVKDLEDKISKDERMEEIDDLVSKISKTNQLLEETIKLLNSNRGDKEELEDYSDRLYSLRAKYKSRLIGLQLEELEG